MNGRPINYQMDKIDDSIFKGMYTIPGASHQGDEAYCVLTRVEDDAFEIMGVDAEHFGLTPLY
jgi:hypothetical protein